MRSKYYSINKQCEECYGKYYKQDSCYIGKQYSKYNNKDNSKNQITKDKLNRRRKKNRREIIIFTKIEYSQLKSIERHTIRFKAYTPIKQKAYTLVFFWYKWSNQVFYKNSTNKQFVKIKS